DRLGDGRRLEAIGVRPLAVRSLVDLFEQHGREDHCHRLWALTVLDSAAGRLLTGELAGPLAVRLCCWLATRSALEVGRAKWSNSPVGSTDHGGMSRSPAGGPRDRSGRGSTAQGSNRGVAARLRSSRPSCLARLWLWPDA